MFSRGLFVTVEGGEGVGKSTNIDCLVNYLVDNDIEPVVTREPGGTVLGEDIRDVLLRVDGSGMQPMTELLLVFAARAQHIHEVIIPALDEGRWVVCDRFTDATYAYQSGGAGVAVETVSRLEELVQGSLRPDFTLLLDAPVVVGMARARGRGDLDRIERQESAFFDRVRDSYLQQAEQNSARYRVIDASVELAVVQQQVKAVGAELLHLWSDRMNRRG
ncbi:MAG: dTMP kinase [Halioglobus sp.]|nr:dTMP kinase [Halioglobus sp.]